MQMKDLVPASLMPGSDADAVNFLKDDHKRVNALFDEFEKIKDGRASKEKQRIVTEACNELRIHTQLEEEIFYPALRKAIDEDDMMNEAVVEHQTAKDLIARLERMTPDNDMYVGTFTVLSEYIKHHVKEEEDEMFPLARKSDVDLDALGDKMQKRKFALQERGVNGNGKKKSARKPRPSRH